MNNKNNQAKHHHYIPQFILKNFTDSYGYLNYFDKKTNKEEYLTPKEVFVVDDLYRDDKNNPNLPVEIENDLSTLEGAASRIINKFLFGNEVTISKDEEQLLKIFVFVMCFRSKRIKDAFVKNIGDFDRKLYSEFQVDGDMESWWKRNLAAIVKCRNVDDILNNPQMDKFVKLYFIQDTIGFEGSYFMIYRIKGKDKLILSDTYPLVETFTNDLMMKYKNIYMPISPDRILILVKNFSGKYLYSELLPSEQFLIQPIENEDSFTYQVGKQFKNFTDEFNASCIKDAEFGYIFCNKTR